MSGLCQEGRHEVVTAVGGRQCDGRDTRCPCWCHVVAGTDRRLLERCADEATAVTRPASVLDLAAHLRSGTTRLGMALDEAAVEALVRLVLGLGWRQVLGHPLPEDARVPDPLLVSAATVRALDSDVDHEADGAIEELLAGLHTAEGRRPRPAPTTRPVEEVTGV